MHHTADAAAYTLRDCHRITVVERGVEVENCVIQDLLREISGGKKLTDESGVAEMSREFEVTMNVTQ